MIIVEGKGIIFQTYFYLASQCLDGTLETEVRITAFKSLVSCQKAKAEAVAEQIWRSEEGSQGLSLLIFNDASDVTLHFDYNDLKPTYQNVAFLPGSSRLLCCQCLPFCERHQPQLSPWYTLFTTSQFQLNW